MTDETKVRVRGQKEREAAYRAGFAAGVEHAISEHARLKQIEAEREHAVARGLGGFMAGEATKPRRARKKRGNPDVNADAAQAGNL